MNENISNALAVGEKLIKGISNIKRRIHVKSATGFSKKEEMKALFLEELKEEIKCNNEFLRQQNV